MIPITFTFNASDYITHLRKYGDLFKNITVNLGEDDMRYLVILCN